MEQAGLTTATTSRVLSYLASAGLIERLDRGPIVRVDWKRLLERWATEYKVLEANRAEFFIEPRGPLELLRRLQDVSLKYVVTGSLAAIRRAPVATPALAAVYVDDFAGAVDQLNLRSTSSGANVVLIQPTSRVPFQRKWREDGVTYAALSQVAADLLNLPGRSPTEAAELIEWMERNEDTWRR
jgi:hypothetical protein